MENLVTRKFMYNDEFWRNKRVLVTGHTGFKGAWLTLLLARKGALIKGVSLPPDQPSLYVSAGVASACESAFINILDRERVKSEIREWRP